MKNYIFIIVLFSISCHSNSEKKISENIPIPSQKKDSINYDSISAERKSSAIERKKYYDSIKIAEKWQEISPEVWKNKNGELGIETFWGTEEGVTGTYFIKEDAERKPLNKVVDIPSFKYLGSSFYKDKNAVYTHYVMAEGGNFWKVEDADPETFRVIGDCYAKDKNHIFDERDMKMDSVDYATFRTAKGCGCYAKDKNGYYFWDRKTSEEEIDKEVLKKLKEL